MNRRNFLRISGAAATDRFQLGPMKVELSRLAMGTGTTGSGGSSNLTKKLGVTGVSEMFKAAYGQGLTFWDSADQYGSHPHLKEELKSVPREKVTILTTTHASSEAENIDYLDILLLHNMTDGHWPERKKGALAVISEARKKGIVPTHGTSCHTLEALKTLADTDCVQVAMDADPATVIRCYAR